METRNFDVARAYTEAVHLLSEASKRARCVFISSLVRLLQPPDSPYVLSLPRFSLFHVPLQTRSRSFFQKRGPFKNAHQRKDFCFSSRLSFTFRIFRGFPPRKFKVFECTTHEKMFISSLIRLLGFRVFLLYFCFNLSFLLLSSLFMLSLELFENLILSNYILPFVINCSLLY